MAQALTDYREIRMASFEVERRYNGDIRNKKPKKAELFRVFPTIVDTYYSFNPFVRVRYAECVYPEKKTMSILSSKQEFSGELDETEISIEDFKKGNKILSLLRNPVVIVSGSREEYKIDDLHICFDYVNGLGYCTEIEKIVINPNEIPQALTEVEKAFSEFFGVQSKDLEKRTYPEILLKK